MVRATEDVTMSAKNLVGLTSIVLGADMAANAVLGPPGLGVIESRISENMENQLIGGEIVSLLVAAPLATVVGLLWRRGHRLAPLSPHGVSQPPRLVPIERRAGHNA
jgi:hypothetical protein